MKRRCWPLRRADTGIPVAQSEREPRWRRRRSRASSRLSGRTARLPLPTIVKAEPARSRDDAWSQMQAGSEIQSTGLRHACHRQRRRLACRSLAAENAAQPIRTDSLLRRVWTFARFPRASTQTRCPATTTPKNSNAQAGLELEHGEHHKSKANAVHSAWQESASLPEYTKRRCIIPPSQTLDCDAPPPSSRQRAGSGASVQTQLQPRTHGRRSRLGRMHRCCHARSNRH